MTWTIYCHVLVADGRRYVGLTKKTMLRRWNQHVYMAKSSKGGRWHFPNAIRKYGKEAFSHEILETCEDLEVANLAEESWIELLDTRNPERGFNLAKGGKHRHSPTRKNPWNDPGYRARVVEASKTFWTNHTISPQTRARISAGSRGRPKSPATIEKIRANGSKKTPESLQKMKESLVRFYAEKPYVHRCERGPDGKLYATCKKCSPEVPVEFRPDARGKHPRCNPCRRAQQNARYARVH